MLQGSTMGSIISEMGWLQLCTRGLPLRIAMVGTLTGLQVRLTSCLCSCSAPWALQIIAAQLWPSLVASSSATLHWCCLHHTRRIRPGLCIHLGTHHTLTPCPVVALIEWGLHLS